MHATREQNEGWNWDHNTWNVSAPLFLLIRGRALRPKKDRLHHAGRHTIPRWNSAPTAGV